MSVTAPVLLVAFNRPALTLAAMERLRRVCPSKLYIAVDGPRAGHPTDDARCAEVRDIVSRVDWPCEVHRLVRDRNLGCGPAVGGAISWFFESEEAGIILEDDIEPDDSFFPFCEELLERYRDDERVGIISGCNFTAGQAPAEGSYMFVRNMHMWGWATWRRVWQLVDLYMKDWNRHPNVDFLSTHYGAPWATRQMWASWFDSVANGGRAHIWDYQVCYALWRRGMLSIAPAVNLIDNNGFGLDATHPGEKPPGLRDSPHTSIAFPLRHPPAVVRDRTADPILDRNNGITLRRSLKIATRMRIRKLRRRFGRGSSRAGPIAA